MRVLTLFGLVTALLVPAAASQPGNDSSGRAIAIGTEITSTTRTGTNVGATAGEIEASCQANTGASVWWSYVPAADGLLTVDSAGSTFDTVVSVYRWGGTEIACDDDGSEGTQSRLEGVSLRASTTYYIRVAGYSSEQGDVRFTFEYATAGAPENDAIADAIEIPSSPAEVVGSTVGATRETDVNEGTAEAAPSCGGTQVASVWYRYTAPVAGALTVDLSGSSFDTAMSLTSYDGRTELACDDDGGEGSRSRIAGYALAAGEMVLIRVAGFGSLGSNVGALALALELDAAPANDDRAGATVLPATGAVTGHNYGATVEADEPLASCSDSGASTDTNSSVWYAYTVPGQGRVTVTLSSAAFFPVLALYLASDLSELACNAHIDGSGRTSAVRDLAVTGGQEILIRVADDGPTREHGPFALALEFQSTVAGEDGPSAVSALTVAPNPASGRARLRLSVDRTQPVEVSVYDVAGRRVATLFTGDVAAGAPRDITLESGRLPAGVYLVRAVGETLALTQRLTVAR